MVFFDVLHFIVAEKIAGVASRVFVGAYLAKGRLVAKVHCFLNCLANAKPFSILTVTPRKFTNFEDS